MNHSTSTTAPAQHEHALNCGALGVREVIFQAISHLGPAIGVIIVAPVIGVAARRAMLTGNFLSSSPTRHRASRCRTRSKRRPPTSSVRSQQRGVTIDRRLRESDQPSNASRR